MTNAPSGAELLLDYDVAMEVAAHEALIRQTYKDSAGILTWCVGMTNATGHRVERYIGKPASLQTCMDVYVWALDNYAAGVREVFKGFPITKAQFAAALSFHWNTGAIKRASWVTKFKAGDIAGAKKAFMNWSTPASIKARRKKERDLFFDGNWSNDGTMTEYTRLRSNMQPDFTSGGRLNVSVELHAAFAAPTRPIIDQTPQPDSKPAAPTLSPDISAIPASTGPISSPPELGTPIPGTVKPVAPPVPPVASPEPKPSAAKGFAIFIAGIAGLWALASSIVLGWWDHAVAWVSSIF